MYKSLQQIARKFPLPLGFILVGLIGILPFHFTEVATKPFWWNFWIILGSVVLAACVVGWIYLQTKSRKD